MTYRRRLAVLALALPTWIVMILAGGEWCLMPGSASASAVAERGARDVAPSGHHANAHNANAHQANATQANAHHAPALAEVAATNDAPPSLPHRSHHSGDARTCTSPAACTVAIAPARWTFVEETAPRARPLLASSDRPSSVVVAPELPPPRA